MEGEMGCLIHTQPIPMGLVEEHLHGPERNRGAGGGEPGGEGAQEDPADATPNGAPSRPLLLLEESTAPSTAPGMGTQRAEEEDEGQTPPLGRAGGKWLPWPQSFGGHPWQYSLPSGSCCSVRGSRSHPGD